MTFWLRLCLAASCAALLSILAACGGGGGGGPSGSASVTVTEGSFYIPEGSFDSKSVEKLSDTFAVLGLVHIVAYDMGAFGVGVAYVESTPQAFSFALLTPDGLEYSCVSQVWADEFGETSPTCPESVTMNVATRKLTFTSAVLQRSDLPSDTVTASGNLQW